jgi:hypothetical protein
LAVSSYLLTYNRVIRRLATTAAILIMLHTYTKWQRLCVCV